MRCARQQGCGVNIGVTAVQVVTIAGIHDFRTIVNGLHGIARRETVHQFALAFDDKHARLAALRRFLLERYKAFDLRVLEG